MVWFSLPANTLGARHDGSSERPLRRRSRVSTGSRLKEFVCQMILNRTRSGERRSDESGAAARALQDLAETRAGRWGAPASWSAERQFRFGGRSKVGKYRDYWGVRKAVLAHARSKTWRNAGRPQNRPTAKVVFNWRPNGILPLWRVTIYSPANPPQGRTLRRIPRRAAMPPWPRG